MREIVERLKENRQVELAKSILESNGYIVSLCESEISWRGSAQGYNGTITITGDGEFPESLAQYIRNVYDLGDSTYKLEYLTTKGMNHTTSVSEKRAQEIEKKERYARLISGLKSAGWSIVYE